VSVFDLASAYRGSVFAIALDRMRTLTIATIVPLTVLVIWAIASAQGWLPEQILPPPAYVWQNLLEMVRNGDLAQHASISAIRVLVGFTVGASLGLPARHRHGVVGSRRRLCEAAVHGDRPGPDTRLDPTL
jgi:ABC-type nitrate/sulfonate/bicarbonate transport system permease component